jgi:ferredoxin
MKNQSIHRSRKLLDLARDQACVSCGIQDGTIVAAHSDLLEHNKGMGHKAHDCMHAWLCYTCHTSYDQGGVMNSDQKRDFILTMIARTVTEMWQQGLIGTK